MTSLLPFGLIEAIPDELRLTEPGTAPTGRWPTRHAGAPHLARQVLEAEATAPGAARRFLQHTLRGWALDPLVDDATIIASELVTNALKYGAPTGPPFELSSSMQLVLLGHPRRLTLVVTQSSVGEPSPVPSDGLVETLAESGHGLHIVTALSASWGWARLATGGTAVWATLHSMASSRRAA